MLAADTPEESSLRQADMQDSTDRDSQGVAVDVIHERGGDHPMGWSTGRRAGKPHRICNISQKRAAVDELQCTPSSQSLLISPQHDNVKSRPCTVDTLLDPHCEVR